MIYIALLIYLIGIVIDIGGLFISVRCATKRKNLKLGKLALTLAPYGEKLTKVALFLLAVGLVDKFR